MNIGIFERRLLIIACINNVLRNQLFGKEKKFIGKLNMYKMKKLLNWEDKEVVNLFDEVTLWSAPFGRMLLENIPMKTDVKIVDIGFGTGFPLIELSQRFGDSAKVYGIDIWEEGINRVKEKLNTLEIQNIEIIEQSAAKIGIENNQIDLVTSNLGINNFEEKEKVYFEVKRILKKRGSLCITTNPIGTFKELFELFEIILNELELEEELTALEEYIKYRNTKEGIISELNQCGFKLVKEKVDSTNLRFVNSMAVLNHSLMRIGFRKSWEKMTDRIPDFFERLTQNIDKIIEEKGEFIMTVPMLYLEFEKE